MHTVWGMAGQTYRLVDDVGLVDMNVREVVQAVHCARSQRLVCQGRFRCKAAYSAEIIDSSIVVDLIPNRVTIHIQTCSQ